ncbi:MAG: hypothetical protein WCO56_29570 [Verrucomicrobiota bacterium]
MSDSSKVNVDDTEHYELQAAVLDRSGSTLVNMKTITIYPKLHCVDLWVSQEDARRIKEKEKEVTLRTEERL